MRFKKYAVILLSLLFSIASLSCDSGGETSDGDADSPSDGDRSACQADSDCQAEESCGADGYCIPKDIDGDDDSADGDLSPDAQLSISPEELNFGAVAIGERSELELTIKNAGQWPLTIYTVDLGTSSAEFSLAAGISENINLEAGKGVTIVVAYEPADVGVDQGMLIINSNDPFHPTVNVRLISEYIGNPTLEIIPPKLDFGPVHAGRTSDQNVLTLKNNIATGENRAIIISEIYFESRGYSQFELVNPPTGDLILSPATPVDLKVIFKPVEVGDISDTLIIESDVGTETGEARASIEGEGVAGEIASQPDSLDFGAADVDSTKNMDLEIRNLGQYDLTLFSTRIEGEAVFTVNSANPPADEGSGNWTVIPQGKVTFTLTFSPVSTGEASASFIVENDDPRNEAFSIALNGQGQAIGLVINPESALFSDTKLGDSSDTTLFFRRHEDYSDPISIDTIVISQITHNSSVWSGEAPFLVQNEDDLPLMLDDDFEHPLTYVFTAPKEGRFNALAILHTSPIIDPPPSIAFSALATTPHFTPSIALGNPIDFGEIRLGDRLTTSYIINDTGLADLHISELGLDPLGFPGYSILSPLASSFTIEPAQSKTVTIELAMQADDPTGTASSSLHLETDDLEIPSLDVPITAEAINPKLLVLPAHEPFYSLGNVPTGALGEWHNLTVTFSEESVGALVISGIEIIPETDPGFEFQGLDGLSYPITLQPAREVTGSSITFQLRFSSSQDGTFAGGFIVQSNDFAEPAYAVDLQVNVNACAELEVLCDNQCVDAYTLENCSGQDGCSPCPEFTVEEAYGSAYCSNEPGPLGECALICEIDYDDCNESFTDGCESFLMADIENCHECGISCEAPDDFSDPVCSNGRCDFLCHDNACRIGDGCVPEGSASDENACRICRPDINRFDFSDADNDTQCVDDLFCTVDESCQEGVCTPGADRDCTLEVEFTEAQCQAASCNEPIDECEVISDKEGEDCIKDSDSDGWYNTGDTGPGCLTMYDISAEYRDFSCNAGVCRYTVTDNLNCNDQDGFYEGGDNEGCGADPDSEKRDYYVDASGSCTYSTEYCATKNCDGFDVCDGICNGDMLYAYRDYFVDPGTDDCSYEMGPLVDDCTSMPSSDSDGAADAYTVGGTVEDYTSCHLGSCEADIYRDFCDESTVYEYGADASGISGPTPYDCEQYESNYCGPQGRFIYRNEWRCSGSPGACNDSATDIQVGDCGTGACSGDCGSTLNGCTFNGEGCFDAECFDSAVDVDEAEAFCSTCGLSWNAGGEVAASSCCGDDLNEHLVFCSDSTPSGDCGSNNKACCTADTDCVDSTGNCTDTDTCDIFGGSGRKSYCQSGTWQDPDESSDFCVAQGCAFSWLTAANKCCGDDPGEDTETLQGNGSCCYNATLLLHGDSLGSILCSNGELYDCNNLAGDDSGLAVAKLSCDQQGDQFCTSTGTWSEKLSDGCNCQNDNECINDSCADGVCCENDCTGTCVACNVPGHKGSCTGLPSGTDPLNECGTISCNNHYFGWVGNTCYQRENIAPGIASCNGAGACQTAADLCPSQGQGSSSITCDDTCQEKRTNTCIGSTAGICDNLNPGNTSCGDGNCRNTIPICTNGEQNTCVPLDNSSPETCDNEDDNCNGETDEGILASIDDYEPNDTCGVFNDLGTVNEFDSVSSFSGTIYTIEVANDEDFFHIFASEGSHICFPGTDQDYRLQVKLLPPQGADCQDYDLYLYNNACSSLRSSINASCNLETINYDWDGSCGGDDSRHFRIRVLGYSGASECASYTMSVDMWQI